MDIVSNIVMLLGGIAVFIVGMSFMRDGLESIAGKKMQRIISKISGNRWAGVGIGTGVTAVIQSSTATTLMTIGFVGAGVMTLFQATAIIIGANIGTTLTAFLAASSTFGVLSSLLQLMAIIGVFMKLLAKKDRTKYVGDILLGLGLLFIGLDLLSSAFKGPEISAAITTMFQTISFPLLLLLLGILVTAIMQSSSAVTSILVAMGVANAISIDYAFYVVLGANIGTCLTGVLASIGSPTDARRVAIVQVLLNSLGVLIFLPLTWIFSDQLVGMFNRLFPGQVAFQIAFYHLGFNFLTALIATPLIKRLIALTCKIVPEKVKPEDFYKLVHVDELILNNPLIGIVQIKKEILRMAGLAYDNLKSAMEAINNQDLSNSVNIEKTESLINYLNKTIAQHLIKLSSINVSRQDESKIGSFHHVINDIERIGDHAKNFLDVAQKMSSFDLAFSEQGNKEINIMYNIILGMYDLAVEILSTDDKSKLPTLSKLEERVDSYQKELDINYISRVRADHNIVDSGPFFYTIVSGLERIGDHLTNIAYSISSPTGDEL